MENSSITVTLKRLSGKVVRSDWQCQNGRELLRELERLDHTAARASWLYKGFPLEEDEILPAQLELQEVLPWRNWKSWDVDENHIQRLDGLAQDPSVRTQHLRVNKYNPPDISILCCEEDDSPTWLYACTYELALCLTSFAWRRLVLELMAFNDLQCRGSRLCRVTQLQQMRRELRKLSELRENAGIHGEGDDCLQATWPFGEASRIEMQEALSKKLMKNQAKRAAESEVDAEVQQRLRTDSADLLCNLAVVLLLQPWPTSLDLQRAYAFLKQSLEMDATMDSQHFLQRALRLLRFHELEPDDTPDTGADGETGETEQSRLSVGSNVTHATQVAARLQRENTMFPDTEVEERRCRQLQRIWLGTPSGRWLCKLRQKPLLIHMSPSAVPEGCPELNTKCVEAMLHISDMLHDDIHQVGSGLAAVTWLLLYFGLRRKHPAFLALKQVLGSSPMPNCLQLVRDLADEKLGPGPLGPWRNLQLMVKMEESLRKEKGGARRTLMVLAQLETLILDALASIRCNELFQGFHYGQEFEGLCFRHLPKAQLSHEDQLEILDRRARLLEMLLGTPPRAYTQHPKTEGTDGGLMNRELTHGLFRGRVMRHQNSFLAKDSRYSHPMRSKKD
ncbi:unnamed protein product [Cladocopium goreaui]|uniref:Kinesin-related protein 1 n=1 Tax=Cladocopium goreaui TaxID=2562237 RepID=A0A9P1DJL3_9DINO|nr:unnamed protein product [Cladocopium goreaui]